MPSADEIRQTLRAFILDSFMKGAPPSELADDASLSGTYVMDSARVLDLILFLEETYAFEVQNDEALPENFDTVDNVVAYVQRKLSGRP